MRTGGRLRQGGHCDWHASGPAPDGHFRGAFGALAPYSARFD